MDKEATLKPVYVEWVDPHSVDPWTPLSEIETMFTVIKSIGWLLKQTEDTVVIALNYNEPEEDVSCAMIIPKSAIKEMRQVSMLGLVDER